MKNYQRCLGILLSALISNATLAGDAFDVDEADSLDFESFHKTKEGSIKIYDTDTGEVLPGRNKNQTVKTYEAESKAEATASAKPEQQTAAKPAASQPAEKASKAEQAPGQRYEIRQRYAVGESENTSDTPYTAMNALHRKMAKYCPEGWVKEKEWSVPVDTDFYLHYEFTCQ